MNKVFLIGNLTKEPDVKYTVSDNPTCVCKFALAVNDGYGDQQKTSFINITVFGKSGENCERFLNKGSKVAVEGYIQTGSYEKDGRKVYTTDVIAKSIEFLNIAQDNRLP
jgi:single-strand DNA-binding protein